MVKETSRDFLHMFSTLYINDIYLKTQEEHMCMSFRSYNDCRKYGLYSMPENYKNSASKICLEHSSKFVKRNVFSVYQFQHNVRGETTSVVDYSNALGRKHLFLSGKREGALKHPSSKSFWTHMGRRGVFPSSHWSTNCLKQGRGEPYWYFSYRLLQLGDKPKHYIQQTSEGSDTLFKPI